MVRPSPLRSVLVALIGAAVYFGLLWLLYSRAPYTAVPPWWRHLLPKPSIGTVTWFTLINAGTAVLAAIPVAIGVAVGTPSRRLVLGLVIGIVPALYIVGGGLIEYGVPPSLDGFIVDVGQFLAVSLAVTGVIALVQRYSPTFVGASAGKQLR